jgi:anti-sigma B factor antagonist
MMKRSAFRVAVEHTGAGVAIAVSGDVDVATIARLEDALAEALEDSPPVVLIDLRDVGFVDSTGLKFLLRTRALADRSGWTLQIYRPGETAMKAFVVTGADRWLPFVDAGAAAAEPASGDEPVGGTEAERGLRLEIPGTQDAPRAARLAVRDLIEDHPLASGQLDSLMLLVSEVVTNAVTHPQLGDESDVEFTVTVTPELTRVLVSDGGTGFDWPAESLPQGRVDGGYGILLLDGQSSRWGTDRMPGRFTVWFEIDHALEPVTTVVS